MIESSQSLLSSFVKEHSQMKEMIRQFDEIISDKVNKFALLSLEEKIKDSYLKKSQFHNIEDSFHQTQSDIQKRFDEINALVDSSNI